MSTESTVHLEAVAGLSALTVSVDNTSMSTIGHRTVSGFVLAPAQSGGSGTDSKKVVQHFNTMTRLATDAEDIAVTLCSYEPLCGGENT